MVIRIYLGVTVLACDIYVILLGIVISLFLIRGSGTSASPTGAGRVAYQNRSSSTAMKTCHKSKVFPNESYESF